jgi:hypothetical protein
MLMTTGPILPDAKDVVFLSGKFKRVCPGIGGSFLAA